MKLTSSRVGDGTPIELEHRGGHPGPDRHVTALARLADVVQQGAEQQRVAVVGQLDRGALDRIVGIGGGEDRGHGRHRPGQMRVDREPVVGVALGAASNLRPGGDQARRARRRGRARRGRPSPASPCAAVAGRPRATSGDHTTGSGTSASATASSERGRHALAALGHLGQRLEGRDGPVDRGDRPGCRGPRARGPRRRRGCGRRRAHVRTRRASARPRRSAAARRRTPSPARSKAGGRAAAGRRACPFPAARRCGPWSGTPRPPRASLAHGHGPPRGRPRRRPTPRSRCRVGRRRRP